MKGFKNKRFCILLDNKKLVKMNTAGMNASELLNLLSFRMKSIDLMTKVRDEAISNRIKKENSNQCQRCNSESTSRCSKCKTAKYCSRECQVSDWSKHKQTCGKQTPLLVDVEKFKCKLCSELLEDPVILPCCGSFVCTSHVNVLENTIYFCDICHEYGKCRFRLGPLHAMFKYHTRSYVSSGLKYNPKQFLSVAKETIQKAEKAPRMPKMVVLEYFDSIRQHVDITMEEIREIVSKEIDTLSKRPPNYKSMLEENFKKLGLSHIHILDEQRAENKSCCPRNNLKKDQILAQVDSSSTKLIKCIDKNQSECVDLAKAMKPWFNETLVKDLKALVKKIEEETPDISQFEEVNRQLLELKFKCDKMLSVEEHLPFLLNKHWTLLNNMESTYSFIEEDLIVYHIGPIKYIEATIERIQKELKEKSKDIQNNSMDSKIMPYFQRQLIDMYGFQELRDFCDDDDGTEKIDEEESQGMFWRLVYRGSRDGFSAKDFHSKCDGIKHTMTLVKSKDGSIFGGFANKAWKSDNGTWVDDPKASIFTVANKDGIRFSRGNSERKTAIWHSAEHGPCFGKDIWISSNSNDNRKSFCNLGHSYKKKNPRLFGDDYKFDTDRAKSLLAGSYHFRTAEIEVFEVYEKK